ncbi:hypothetical protein AB833_31430 [Chromatiales bacterium (ex Bugula neritina AB1)]|nr:hypothetical protein AB833_31430 [Chromatiales bacterium (ex Bugula neritina AB1)]
MTLAVLLFPFMNTMVKLLREDFDPAMIIWARYVSHLLLMLALFLPTHGLSLLKSSQPRIQTGRSLLLLIATISYFTALGHVPLATAAIIGFTSPFIVTALSSPILGEQVGWRRWGAVLVGFIGAVIVIRPGTGALHPLAALVLITACCYGLYQIYTRKISASDSAATTITYTALVGAVVSSIAVPFFWQTPETLQHVVLLSVAGMVGGLGHYFVVKAFQFAQASLLAPVAYGQIVGATLLGYIIFGDLPDNWTWLGTSIIIGCGLYIGYRERATSIK